MKPNNGSTVLFTLPDGQVRPAKVTRVWSPGDENSALNMQVFVDGSNDAGFFSEEECTNGTAWKTSVLRGNEPGQWSPMPEAS